jgi:hypothetical protein
MSAFSQEAKQKWGHTQAYREYEEKHHTAQAQNALAEGLDRIMGAFALCMNAG